MRFSTLFIMGFLVGCSGAPDTADETDSGYGGAAPEPPGYYDPDHNSGPGACGNAVEFMQFSLPDGGVVVIEVPIPCNPYWRDTGDPPPDRERESIVDPPPDELNVRPMEKYER